MQRAKITVMTPICTAGHREERASHPIAHAERGKAASRAASGEGSAAATTTATAAAGKTTSRAASAFESAARTASRTATRTVRCPDATARTGWIVGRGWGR